MESWQHMNKYEETEPVKRFGNPGHGRKERKRTKEVEACQSADLDQGKRTQAIFLHDPWAQMGANATR